MNAIRIDKVILYTLALNSIYNFQRQYGAKLVLTPFEKRKNNRMYLLTLYQFQEGILW